MIYWQDSGSCDENGKLIAKRNPETFHEGYLTKKGAVPKSWKKRWFLIDGGSLLYFHEKPNPRERTKASGYIKVKGCKCGPNRSEDERYVNSFQIIGSGNTHLMFADSRDEFKQWRTYIVKNGGNWDEKLARKTMIFDDGTISIAPEDDFDEDELDDSYDDGFSKYEASRGGSKPKANSTNTYNSNSRNGVNQNANILARVASPPPGNNSNGPSKSSPNPTPLKTDLKFQKPKPASDRTRNTSSNRSSVQDDDDGSSSSSNTQRALSPPPVNRMNQRSNDSQPITRSSGNSGSSGGDSSSSSRPPIPRGQREPRARGEPREPRTRGEQPQSQSQPSRTTGTNPSPPTSTRLQPQPPPIQRRDSGGIPTNGNTSSVRIPPQNPPPPTPPSLNPNRNSGTNVNNNNNSNNLNNGNKLQPKIVNSGPGPNSPSSNSPSSGKPTIPKQALPPPPPSTSGRQLPKVSKTSSRDDLNQDDQRESERIRKLEQERERAQIEKEKERERERERDQKEQRERERAEKERERAERERAEKRQMERDREKERVEKERIERERNERERQERDRLERERIERERNDRERERMEKERQERERKDKIERDRKEAEIRERQRIQLEKEKELERRQKEIEREERELQKKEKERQMEIDRQRQIEKEKAREKERIDKERKEKISDVRSQSGSVLFPLEIHIIAAQNLKPNEVGDCDAFVKVKYMHKQNIPASEKEAIVTEIRKLAEKKKQAIAKEDYDTAMYLKKQIEDLELKAKPRTSQEKETKVIPETLAPSFDERFDYDIYDEEDEIVVEVWDDYIMDEARFCGYNRIKVSQLMKARDLWIQLFPRNSRDVDITGKIYISVQKLAN